ncbi:MAG: hypothetical protein AAF449_19805, partial [Myxococcota bacterium]
MTSTLNGTELFGGTLTLATTKSPADETAVACVQRRTCSNKDNGQPPDSPFLAMPSPTASNSLHQHY